MTTRGLQAALVELIRLPEANRGADVEAFVNRFDLTARERWQVRALAGSPLVRKFGREQRDKRYGFSIKKNLRYSRKLLDEAALDEVLAEFDEEHAFLAENRLYPAFIRYLVGSASIRARLKVTAATLDLMRYEYAVFSLNTDSQYWEGWSVPEGSRLCPDAPFIIEELGYDVLDYSVALEAASDGCEVPTPGRHRTLLLIFRVPADGADAGHYRCEQFEIDDDVREFLLQELRAPGNRNVPGFYEGLVEVGLCKALD